MYQENYRGETTDNESVTIFDEISIVEDEVEKEKKIMLTMQKINLIYEKVIVQFQTANFPTYNPNILSKMTKQKFISWVIENNDEIAQYFN